MLAERRKLVFTIKAADDDGDDEEALDKKKDKSVVKVKVDKSEKPWK